MRFLILLLLAFPVEADTIKAVQITRIVSGLVEVKLVRLDADGNTTGGERFVRFQTPVTKAKIQAAMSLYYSEITNTAQTDASDASTLSSVTPVAVP